MVDGRQRAQRIGTRYTHLTQHVNLDGACLAQRDTDVRALIELAQLSTDAVLGSTNLQTTNLNRSDLRNIDIALRTYREREVIPGGAIDVDYQHIART